MKIGVIGAGFSGLASAAVLAANGHDVHIHEKHTSAGGRARQFESDGFVFDMGPSWYWMPDVFESFFNRFGKSASDYYQLEKLDPAFRMYFHDEVVDVPGSYEALREMFESRMRNGASRLDSFMEGAEYKYRVGMQHLVYKPAESWLEFVTPEVVKGAMRLNITSSVRKHVKKYFRDPVLVALMEFPVLFLGAMPDTTPALYSLMNYAGLKVGTYYPMGGFGKVVDAMLQVATDNGAVLHTDNAIEQIGIHNGRAKSLHTSTSSSHVDAVIASADYSHVDQRLLPEAYRNYSPSYWSSRVLAPSCLLFYLGVDKKVDGLLHHNLFFDADLDKHAGEIYKNPKWPDDPLFYVCSPSKTDPQTAPEGRENLFVLMPLAPDLEDTPEMRDRYYRILMERMEKYTGERIDEHIVYKRSYCVNDFKSDYNALRGNAYGLANTLRQTAVLKPRLRSKKVNNLFYTGHLTVPGPGVPPALISGQVAADMLLKTLKPSTYATTV